MFDLGRNILLTYRRLLHGLIVIHLLLLLLLQLHMLASEWLAVLLGLHAVLIRN